MADPFSIAVSVLTIASTVTGVSTKLYNLHEEVAETKNDISNLAETVSTTGDMLKRIGQMMKRHHRSICRKTSNDVKVASERCARVVKELETIVERLRGSPAIRFKWMFEKSKAKQMQIDLDRCKMDLNMVLQHLSLEHCLRRSR